MTVTVCPICKKSLPKPATEFPFCSERCRTIDLGVWATEGYVISTPLQVGDFAPEEDDD